MKSMNLKGKGNRPPTSSHNKPDFRKMTSDKGQDTHFSYNMTVLIGCSAEVTTRSGEKYEGIFVAYSSTQEIMLEAAHLVSSENDESAISTHYDVLVIPSDKLMAMKFENAVLNYATREFQTDTAISSSKLTTASSRELTLQPWDGGEADTPDELDLSVGEGSTNGWAPGEMFKKNAEKYGVVSSYDQQLSGYTTSLDKTDTETFKKHEEKALQIAEEIERNVTSVERSTVENGDDEEAKYSAVVRESSTYSNSNLNHNNNNNSLSTTNNDHRTDKYVPPSRRNQNQNAQQQSSNSQPPPVNSNMSTGPPNHQIQHPSGGGGGGNARKPSYGGGGPRNSYNSSSNTFYQQDSRRNFDRRGPTQPQYGPPSSHGDGGNRGGRGGKSPMDRRAPPPGRDEIGKKDLMDFPSPPFSLGNMDNRRQSSSGPSNLSHQQQQQQQHSSPMNQVMNQGGGGPGHQSRPNTQNGPNSSTPLRATSLIQKGGEKEKVVPPSPVVDLGSPKVEKIDKVQSPAPKTQSTPETPSRKASDTSEVSSESCSEEKHIVSVVSPSPSESRSISGSDTKSIDSTDSKKPFTFNVNAKEFNPTSKGFTPRSPATPPRPPSTPASTPQLMPVTQGHTPSYIQMPQGTIYLAPQYSQTLSPVTSQNLASSNLPPQRHMNPHRKSMGVSQRADLQSTIPVQTAGPLLAQGTIPNNGQSHPYAAYGIPHQHGYPQPVRIHPPSMVQMYNADVGGEGHAIQLPLHYIHGGAPTAGHPSNQPPTVNVSGQNAAIPVSPHGYSQTGGSHGPHQHHIGYPFVGVPVVGVGYPHPHATNPLLNQRQYYE